MYCVRVILKIVAVKYSIYGPLCDANSGLVNYVASRSLLFFYVFFLTGASNVWVCGRGTVRLS